MISVSSALVSQYAGKAVHVFGISPWGLANNELLNPTSAVLPPASSAAAAPIAVSPSANTTISYPATSSHNVLGIFGVDSSGVISGWACVTGLSDSIPIHFYVGGPAGIGAFAAATTANLSNETAVNQQCSSNGIVQIPDCDGFKLAKYFPRTIHLYLWNIDLSAEAITLLGEFGFIHRAL